MSPITLQTIVHRNPSLVSSNLDGEIVMMSIENGEYYGIDEIGSRIWELLELPISVNELIGILLDEFDAEKPECQSDTLEFLNELLSKNLILLEPNS
jgi:hypothetical protein